MRWSSVVSEPQDAEHVRQLPLAGQLGQTDTEPGSGALIVRSRRAAGATLS